MKSIRFTSLVSAFFLFCSLSNWSMAEEQSDFFISEELYTFMHTGPGKNFRIIGSVNAATPVVLLEKSEDGSYVKIRDGREREGWVEASTLAQGQTRQQIIDELNGKLIAISDGINLDKSEIAQLNNKIAELEQQIAEQQQAVVEANKERDILQQKLGSYTDEIEMQWFINGAIVAGSGLLLGIILSFLPRRKKRKDNWM